MLRAAGGGGDESWAQVAAYGGHERGAGRGPAGRQATRLADPEHLSQQHSQVMGRGVVVANTEGKLHFGPWEHICDDEFDGGRRERVLVKIVGE
ncbi:MAG: hypothetical protein R3B90_07840 [Planctomycetaceae bacterium]